jgi:type IV pilus assembly protein PilO
LQGIELMKQYVFEIVRQKWRYLSIIFCLFLLNVILSVVVSGYQLPLLAELQAKWNTQRRQAAGAAQFDVTALHQKGSVDLEKLKAKIPEKRQFARILGDLLESAASNAVEIGSISYKPDKIKEESLFSYQLTFSVSGSYAAVKSYLSDLQRNPELIVVDSVDFSNSDPLVEHVAMNLHISVYLREGA